MGLSLYIGVYDEDSKGQSGINIGKIVCGFIGMDT